MQYIYSLIVIAFLHHVVAILAHCVVWQCSQNRLATCSSTTLNKLTTAWLAISVLGKLLVLRIYILFTSACNSNVISQSNEK